MREWLIQARKQKGFTQEQVATQCFIDRSYYAQIEKGTRNPSMEVAKKIADALELNPSNFLHTQYEEHPGLATLRDAQMVIAYCNVDLEYLWVYNPYDEIETTNILGKRDDQISSNKGRKDLMAFKQEIRNTGLKMRKNLTFSSTNAQKSYDVYGEPIKDKNGDIIGIITVSIDITKAEQLKKQVEKNMT